MSKKLGIALFLSLVSQGCSTGYYLFQAAKGQLKIMNRGRLIEDVIADPRTSPDLAALLRQIPEFSRFGEQNGLKPTPNYREYVKLEQDAVNYVVTVSSPLKFEPKIFSFPIVGSFNYLGWFSLSDAQDFARGFADQGFDVDVRGASAYSTLGWFRDPLLSSMIPFTETGIDPSAMPDLLNVIVHESVHATLYIPHQSTFNENIASFVADQLTEKFIEMKGLRQSAAWQAYLRREERGRTVRARMARAFSDLSAIYRSSQPDSVKLAQKTAYLEALQKELKFKRPISNATLIQYQTYDPSDQGFEALYERCGRSVSELLARLARLTPEDFESIGCRRQCERVKPLLDRL